MSTSEAARAYAAHGWSIVEFPAPKMDMPEGQRGGKGPNTRGWNLPQNATTDPGEASLFKGNIGLCHAYSRTCCLDVDAWDAASDYLRRAGVDLSALCADAGAVRISSGRAGRAKLLYRLPDGIDPLPSKRPKDSGLELRCASGAGLTVQDVLPPSIHPVTGKPYVWEYGEPLTGHWTDLAPLPDSLLALWRSLEAPASPEARTAPQGVSADRLRAILSPLDPDCDYNTWVKIGSALHHETAGSEEGLDLWDEWSSNGGKYVDRSDLTTHWKSWGRYKGRPVTIQSVISMSGGVSPDDFDDLTALPDQPKRTRFEIIPVGMFAGGPQPDWIIKGVLADATLGVMFAESGAGKTFAAFDMAAKVAAGEAWNGLRVSQRRVVYVAAEGAGGLRKRAAAYAKHFGINLDDLPLGVIADRPNLLKDDHKQLADRINAWGGAGLVIIDTLAQSMPGGDENGGEDMGKVLAHCQLLHSMTGAMILLIHHSGKDATRGARGWSGLKAASDSELELSREGDARFMRVSKQKDGEDGLEWAFKLVTVDLGVDADGDPMTSCVIQWTEMPAAYRRREPVGVWQKAVWNAVNDNLQLCDGMVPLSTVLTSAVASVPYDPTTKDRRREYCMRAVQQLAANGWLAEEGGNVSVIFYKQG